jgi:hypothetical protein
MRCLSVVVSLALILVACGGGGLTLSEYAAQSEELVTTLITRIDLLDAEWESQIPTVDGARTYWDQRLEARVEFRKGIQALDPPDEVADFHDMTLDLFSRFTAAEEALAARVATFETATSHAEWWDTPEGRAAQAIDDEAVVICHAAQAELDATEGRDVFSDVPWIPSEMKDVVRVAFGCPE